MVDTAGRPRPLRLGDYIAARRTESDIRLSVSRAARLAHVHRTTWTAWEDGTARPDDRNYAGIEQVLQWEPGSVRRFIEDGTPPVALGDSPDGESDREAFERELRGQLRHLSEEEIQAVLSIYESRMRRIEQSHPSGSVGGRQVRRLGGA